MSPIRTTAPLLLLGFLNASPNRRQLVFEPPGLALERLLLLLRGQRCVSKLHPSGQTRGVKPMPPAMTAPPGAASPSKPRHCAALDETWGAVSATQAESPACHRPRPRGPCPISTWHGRSSLSPQSMRIRIPSQTSVHLRSTASAGGPLRASRPARLSRQALGQASASLLRAASPTASLRLWHGHAGKP
jgi:hypothetical protein